MIFRVGFVVAASAAAFAIKGISARGSKSVPKKIVVEEDEVKLQDKELPRSHQKQVEEEEEEVKLISSIFDRVHDSSGIEDEDYLPEFDNLLSGEIDYPLPDVAEKERYETEMLSNGIELQRLRDLVLELQEREVKLEGELLEYYGLKEQESDVSELHKQLLVKSAEIEMMNMTITSLQAEKQKLQDEIEDGVQVKMELEVSRNKIKELQRQIQLEASQTKGQLLLLKQQVSGLQVQEEEAIKKDVDVGKKLKAVRELEVEVVELKRKNKELQLEKRELVMKVETAQGKVLALSSATESEKVSKVREEVNNLKHVNEDLSKQVEGLQINRFSEVEELVYLRWVNACLRYELRNFQAPSEKISARDLNKSLSPRSQERAKQLMLEYAGSERGIGDTDIESNFSQPSSPGSEDFDTASVESVSGRYGFGKKPTLIQKLKKLGKSRDDSSVASSPSGSVTGSPARRDQKVKGPLETLMLRNVGDSVGVTSYGVSDGVASSFQLMSKSVEGVLDQKYPAYKDRHRLALEREKHIKEKAQAARTARFNSNLESFHLPPALSQIREKAPSTQTSDGKQAESYATSKIKLAEIEKRTPRVPRPPPKPSGMNSASAASPSDTTASVPRPPPPPPPPPGVPLPPPPPGSLPRSGGKGDKVHRAPELVEFYQTLMKREAKNNPSSILATSSNVVDARSNMIGEIENRSSFLLEVKADVETQGEFVQSLAAEVRAASFTSISDLVEFVNWLDEELSYLVDERAVLKHFDWPEGKTDALRESAFEYQDLKKLESQITSFSDDPSLPCEASLKKMYKLLEKVENSVYALLRTRDMAVSRYRDFGIPVDWLSDTGVVGKIKLASVQLARKYMTRVSSELDANDSPEKEPEREFLVLQGVRFAFRVHQFAGGFDSESMKAFEELRSRAHSQSQTTKENSSPL